MFWLVLLGIVLLLLLAVAVCDWTQQARVQPGQVLSDAVDLARA